MNSWRSAWVSTFFRDPFLDVKRYPCRTNFSRYCSQATRRRVICSAHSKKFGQIDVKSLSPIERERLRLRSKAIPLVADTEPLDVIHEDEHLLVVNKPSFIKMHPSHRFQGGTLLNRAIGHCGKPPHLLHRLDMHTTGVVLFAKCKEICTPIMNQFKEGKVQKEYLLVSDGILAQGEQTDMHVEAPLQRHDVLKFARQVGSDTSDSKPAKTYFRFLDSSTSSSMSVLSAYPRSGRTHQIRVHAAHSGFPIVGDNLYNPQERAMYKNVDDLNRAADDINYVRCPDNNPHRVYLMLHAWKISLHNPVTNKLMSFCAPLPLHMISLLQWAGLKAPIQES